MGQYDFSTDTSISDLINIVDGHSKIKLTNKKKSELKNKHQALKKISKSQIVYGVNTGFGPMVKKYIKPEDYIQLQYNLIRSHACGVGEVLPTRLIRAVIVSRLCSLLKGYSAISLEAVESLIELINKNVTPTVYSLGSVGASGDLIQLAQIAHTMIGEGLVVDNNELIPAKKVFTLHKIKPLQLAGRDGLALINGTSAMTGIAAINVTNAQILINNAVTITAILYEIFSVNIEHIFPTVSKVRPHPGQKYIADELRSKLKDSKNIQKRSIHPHPETGDVAHSPQDIYSLRCVAQILGPCFDTIQNTDQVVTTELNSVTDNPIFDDTHGVIHNGNFHGDYISHEMDKLRISVTKMSILFERQLNLIVNPSVNGLLPPYVNRNTPGLSLALQAVQFIATSTTSENQTLATPMVIHSISTNNDNQDVVSLGTNNALLTNRVIENTFYVQATLVMALLEAVDLRNITLTKPLQNFYKEFRSVFPPLSEDRSLSATIEKVHKKLHCYTQ